MERRTGLLHNQSGDRRDGVLGSSGITISIADHAEGGAVGGGGGGGGGDGGEGNSAGLLPRRGLDFGPGSGGSSGGQYMRPGLGGSEDMLQWSVLTDGSLDSELDGGDYSNTAGAVAVARSPSTEDDIPDHSINLGESTRSYYSDDDFESDEDDEESDHYQLASCLNDALENNSCNSSGQWQLPRIHFFSLVSSKTLVECSPPMSSRGR